jgi:D-3-phosphoglycerate dehydrogenase
MAKTPDPRTARLVYFERWADPLAVAMLTEAAGIDLVRLEYASDHNTNYTEMSRAHGYHILPRGDLQDPWFADARLIERCPNLLAICSTGAGYDMIDVEACTRAGIIVCNQSGSNKEAVAEHALGLMIALSKKISLTDRALRRGDHVDRYKFSGNDLYGKTVGIVGIGQIGSRVAQLCGGLLGMTVLACDPYLTAAEIAARGATKVELDVLLSRSDFVTVHCPRSAETMGLFGERAFSLMKPTAYFINTARGGIHDEAALAQALGAQRIAGAGLDVFLVEPPPHDHPLLSFDTVIATPHSAGVTAEAAQTMARYAAEQWITILGGGVPPRLINPQAWPAYSERFARILGRRPPPLPASSAR